jgi:hypothetical protein
LPLRKRDIGALKYVTASPTPDVMATFYDNFIPSLVDGQYTIKISQALTVDTVQTNKDGGNPNIDNQPQDPYSQTFIVRGPRFSLDPTDIHRVFPPSNTTGVYDDYLPMIVFNKRSLPWERTLNLASSQMKLGFQNPGLYPWLALLVFSDDELIIPEQPSGSTPTPPAGSQASPARSASFALNNIVNSTFNGVKTTGPPSGILGPTIKLEDDEDPSKIFCNVIDISTTMFTNLMATIGDLRFLSHVRQVATADKEPLANAPHDGWFSTAIANRFSIPPANGTTAPQRNIVHLVSLEGLEPYLTPAPQPPPANPLTNFKKVRLISLHSWTFTCLSEPAENFRQLMLNLISAQSERGTDLLLRLPLPESSLPAASGTPQYVATRLQDGYVPLSYNTRTGEQTFAWYRGPFAPAMSTTFLDPTDPENPVDVSAPSNVSEAMVYEPATGLFDQSYAVAFQTGRSLALANQTFATNLLQWRRSAHGIVDKLMEHIASRSVRGILKQGAGIDLNESLPGVTVADLVEVLDGNSVSKSFKKLLATSFRSIAPKIGHANGFDPTATNAMLKSSWETQAVAPLRLNRLMQQPVVVSLLEHLSGVVSLGTTASALSGPMTAIQLQSPGLTESVNAGSSVTIASPDGKTTATVGVAADGAQGDVQIRIVPYTFLTQLPAGSSVQFSQSPILPEQVINWLAQTALLYNVPFNNLVPNDQFLQQETIRFFYLDQNWINSLIDGALSIGVQSSRDSLLQKLMREKLHLTVKRKLTMVRDVLRKVSPTGVPTQDGTRTGFVLRSLAVSGIPGLEIRAYTDAAGKNPMKPLRLDRVAPDIMVGIFPDIPVRVEINEPSEGLIFGFEDEGVALRYLPGVSGASPGNIGEVINPKTPTWLTPTEIQAIKRSQPPNQPPLIIDGAGGLVQALQSKFTNPQPTLSPASLAVEMVRVPEQMLFLPETNGEK